MIKRYINLGKFQTQDKLRHLKHNYKNFLKDYLKLYQQNQSKMQLKGSISNKNHDKKVKLLQVSKYFNKFQH